MSFIEWAALREAVDGANEPIPPKGRRFLPRSSWQHEEVPQKPLAHQFVDRFRHKHPDQWNVLDRWTERQGMTVDDLVERMLKERPGDLTGVYYELLRLAQRVAGGGIL